MNETARVFQVFSILPDKAIIPAVGCSPMPRRQAAKKMRAMWKKLAEEAWGEQRPMVRARLVYIYQPARRGLGGRSYCPRDRDNARAAAKPALDGIVDAGVILGDTHHHIIEDPVEWREETTFGRLTIRLEEVL